LAQSTTILLNTIEDEIRASPSVKRADLLRLAEPPGLTPVRLQIHRNYAFELIGSVLSPFLWLSGLKSVIAYGDYDDSLSFRQIDATAVQIISLEFDRYAKQARSATFRDWLADRLKNLRSVTEKPIIISNWPSAEHQAEEFNLELEKIANQLPSVFVWDIAEIFRKMRENFFDERTALAKGTRLSNSACIEMARCLGLVRLPSALLPRIRAVAVDLDNTLYEGVLGEDGVEGVRVSGQHKAIHKELLRLREEGVFLAVLSKNDQRDFVELCEGRPDFLLKREHFSASSIGWEPKPEGLVRIAEQLRIGLDSILFVDDNFGEIAQMHAAHAHTPLLHSRSAEQTLFWLRHYPALNGYRPDSTTALRVKDLEASRQRDVLQASTNEDDYLREMQIEMTYALNPVDECRRLSELSCKTNQFNTGLRRFSEVEVARRLNTAGFFTVSIGMRDKFCDSGNVGAIFAHADGENLHLDEISISCRALGRTVESPMIVQALAPVIQMNRLRGIVFEFQEGPRNLPARMWLQDFTGKPTITGSNSIRVDWPDIAKLSEYLNAPISSRWEVAPE
jgi:FkbH-like protein